MLSEADLIKGCKNFSRVAQKELYTRYSGKMRGVCLRYCTSSDEAQDILQEGFIKVFSSIDKFSGAGSLEGWIRRIIINTAISFFHKNNKFKNTSIYDTEELEIADLQEGEEIDNDLDFIMKAELSKEELLDGLKVLNDSYRIVFNMFYLENYSHKEIADILNIDEKTSRTRLFRARKLLQKHLYDVCEKKIKTKAEFKLV